MSDAMVKDKGKQKLMLDDYLEDMMNVYNSKLQEAYIIRKNAGLITEAGTSGDSEIFKPLTKAQIRQMAIDQMDADLSTGQKGHTLDEIGSHLAIHFGKTKMSFTYNSYIEPAHKTRDQIRVEQIKSNKEMASLKADWEKKRKAEVKTFTAIAENYVMTGRDYVKDPMGFKVGLGEDIRIDKDKHYKLI